MNKTYNPQAIERDCYQKWKQAGYFAPHNKTDARPYTIMIPPPNVTGRLHMGHGFQHTLMDTLIRFHRMSGDNTLWQMGTDHAGIATQMVVERQLKKNEGINSRHELGREALIERIWAWKSTSGNAIGQQISRLGASVHWDTERFTMDEGFSDAVNEAFIRLHKEGLIYRGKKLVNWDPVLHTAISDLEVINEEEQGFLYYIRYPVVGSKTDDPDFVTVATTRPETLLGDTACAVHPDDKRYKNLIGKSLKLPLTAREIPLIADDYVDADFGTGCVKITPAHDFNDHAMGQRHNLPVINVLTPSATINAQAPSAYQGLDRFEARKRIVADLDAQGLLEKTEPHKLSVPRGDRSGSVIEPYLTDQWFMKMDTLAQPAIDAVKQGDITFHPANWARTYFQWLENIEDWCISRQLWWGHRIPAWYDDAHNVYVGKTEAAVRATYKLADDLPLHQDEDVLDTWFSAALWPFATLGWPQETEALNTFYPTNVLVTGFDIIFFWVARMVMLGLKFTGKAPFHAVYITGLIRDSQGQKMSKSKGNVLDPIDLVDGIDLDGLIHKRTAGLMQPRYAKAIEKATRNEFPEGITGYGSDALRFTYCALATTGRDIRFDVSRLAGYRNFCNKLWNAARYVLMHATSDKDSANLDNIRDFSLVDRWILHALQQTLRDAHEAIATYRFDLLAKHLYEFTWHTYCDWYLELTKSTLNDETCRDEARAATRATLLYVLSVLLRLLHPIIPYITEEIWQRLTPRLAGVIDGPGLESIMLAPYPKANTQFDDTGAATEVNWIQAVISGVRAIRAEMNISPALSIPLILDKGTAQDRERVTAHKALLIKLMKLSDMTWQPQDTALPPAATALVGQLKLCIPMHGLIDKQAEIARLEKAIKKLEQTLVSCTKRLDNPQYVANAPADVVAETREQVKKLTAMQEKYRLQLAEIERV